jgi:outer membrane protein assembly factor BamB
MQLAKIKFLSLYAFFLLISGCVFGPVKELKYQIEDSMDDSESFINNPTELTDIEESIEVVINSKFSFGRESRRSFYLSNQDTKIYYPSINGAIFEFDLSLNQEKLIYKHTINISAGLSTNKNNIYFIDKDGYLISISILGSLQWKAYVGEVYSPPLILDNSVVIKTTNNKFIALNPIDGSELWIYQALSSPLSIRSWEELNHSDNIIYSGISSGKLIAIDSINGSLIWEVTFSQPRGNSELERSNDVTSKPILDANILYIVASTGNISALSSRDGSILWSRPLSSFNGLVTDSEHIYVTHNSGTIYSLFKNTNKIFWRNDNLTGRDVSKGFVFKDYIIFSDYQGYVHFINKASGKFVARIKIGESLFLNPINLNNEYLIYVSTDGILYKLSVPDLIKNNNEVLNDSNINDVNNDLKKSSIENRKQEEDSLIDSLIFWD